MNLNPQISRMTQIQVVSRGGAMAGQETATELVRIGGTAIGVICAICGFRY